MYATTTPAAIETELNNLIDLALKFVQELQKRDSSSGTANGPFDAASFRTAINNGAKVLSHNATKLSLIAPEMSNDTPKVCVEMQTAVLHIAAVVESVPGYLGTTLQDEIRSTTCSLLFDVASLANNFLPTRRTLDTGSLNVGYMSSTGLVWKACEIVEKMSLTNGAAVAKKVKNRTALVEDAIEEVEETLENGGGGGGEDGWGDLMDQGQSSELTDAEKELAGKCLVIMKAAKLLLKKVARTVEKDEPTPPPQQQDEEAGRMLDELVRLADKTSERVDDLVGYIEHPIPSNELADAASLLAQTCAEVVSTVKSLVDDEQTLSWFDTCGSQVNKVLEDILARRIVR
ncbi:hypothetical protein PhCBS80983_g04645 [Powellomyces hirtus]|uniref:Cyclin-D1-binding protein 1 n=1 Tax=Powellomyces hirtus TaxID=109895 RepID=A0A507DWU2_9FUNG|nr:hypothetical protein PhCBS80983_g04645 [Powellomyces hirtus]